jgi:CheY-like chemotaxis protein
MTKKILLIEDIADIRRLIRMTIELDDIEIQEASDGPTGLAMARAGVPDVVILDVMMPGGMDGLEVCRRIRGEPALAGTKVLMLSARGSSHDIEQATAAGADAYLVKPFSPLQLIQVVAGMAFAIA